MLHPEGEKHLCKLFSAYSEGGLPKFSWEHTENQVTGAKRSRSQAIFKEEQVVLRIFLASSVLFSGPLGVFLTSVLGKGYPSGPNPIC